ncbi:DEAD/DEAH box helicase [Candidatus Synechococcus calcipolaris G9]|uniref:DEAD/DEAH box helicase n=1 Tax=Candidatus Synechococcus calcipolaris G9 TaxID=1497997 RepID=A0ABT6F2J2_9SYNE|nr:DEAD/DEAH box helicase [Candidatus Synechococcus calcipolaris]MDG2992008.1 DEAD/DEAH box helicase [Candidatus Synechococcus calcipolaris G9]
MSHYLNPIDAATEPRKNLIRYFLTAYPLRDPHLRSGFKQLLEAPGTISQHPYLEGAQPYQPASTIQQLVAEGVLHPEMARLFNPTRALYQHQEAAIRAVVQEQENIVVATGTGSGKTECFLMPMLDQLLKQPGYGMQALILYPMNALVNDQVKRLRQLLCRQGEDQALIRFGFYTSRTVTAQQAAVEVLKDELEASDRDELLQLFTEEQRRSLNLSRPEYLVREALQQIMRVQAISRQEIWDNPPQILVTNYSMLEHMLIRPREREAIFESAHDFKLLVVDEAHSYNGSTGTEVAMLLKRLRTAVGIEEAGKLRGIATSASLGDRGDPKVLEQVKAFVGDLFSEPFKRVIWGDLVPVAERLGNPYDLPDGLAEADVYEHFCDLELPALTDAIAAWRQQLSYLVPDPILQTAAEASDDVHHFLWLALKQHPTVHRLIALLSQSPQPWDQIARSPSLWHIPTSLDGSILPEEEAKLEIALSNLVQLSTLARQNPDDLPLLPVRLHLLFRSIEGLYACVNPNCPEASVDPNHPERPKRYGKLYLNSKTHCERCAAPVLELSSCRKCGQAYGLTYLGTGDELQLLPRSLEAVENSSSIYVLTAGSLDSITNDEGDDDEAGEADEADDQPTAVNVGTFTIQPGSQTNGWIGRRSPTPPVSTNNADKWVLQWQMPPKVKPNTTKIPPDTKKMPPKAENRQGGYLTRCPACAAGRAQTAAIGRFVSYTDAPLEVMLDSLFELLPEPGQASAQATKRKLLTFSDGRQDAAFFASDFQRTHTETLYRQIVWQAFAAVQQEGVASINQIEEYLVEQFLYLSIPHPDRESDKHHRSYVANDENEEISLNVIDCKKRAQSRAKELLLREFGLPSARRFSIEALGLLACHLEWHDSMLGQVAERFGLNHAEALLFLTGLTDTIRLTGAVDLQGASRYFPETGGIEGGQPARLDSKGRSQIYLKLRRDPTDSQQAIAFLWRKKSNGDSTERQNQIVTYYRNFLGDFPAEEDLLWLFDELLRQGSLVRYQDGRQLHWELLNLRRTETDWHQCNTCQQIFHRPGLSTLKGQSQFGVDFCLAPRCQGILQLFQPEQLADHHYRHLIQERSFLPLRAQEHTAQLGTDELASRESRFRQGKINLLSCSTTLEMGVDIGELQAVALRNFPPHVSNYQQRAGRAGRRTDGVAITLMYGQRRPHDRYYFEQPDKLINGKNQVPKLDPSNFEIQKRHIRAELLAKFLRTEYQVGAEKVTIARFLGLPNTFITLSEIPAEGMIHRLQEWLHSDRAKDLTQRWLERLHNPQPIAFVVQQFEADLQEFQTEQLQDWNGLATVLQELKQAVREAEDANKTKKQKALEYKRDRVRDELDKLKKQQLHEELAKAGILPIYGFPIDVVQLLTRESRQFFQGQGKHRLQRDRRLALGEYAPGQDVVVDDRVHTSVGVMRPDDLPTRHYWVCQACNFFMAASTNTDLLTRLGVAEGDPNCPICRTRLSTNEQKPRSYKIPKAFTTDWSEIPKVTSYSKPMRQPTSQVFLAQEGNHPEHIQADLYHLTLSQGGRFFLANQVGRGFKHYGFAICERCGRDQTDKAPMNRLFGRVDHNHPITGSQCQGQYRRIHLGHEFRSDLLKLRFTPTINPPRLFGTVLHLDAGGKIHSDTDGDRNQASIPVTGAGFWRSLTYALLAAAAQVIDVPRAELDGLFRPVEEIHTGAAEIILYDNVPGGAGYSKRIAECFPTILQRAFQFVESCSCSSSCYDCLRTYTNQIFHHELNRQVVANFLRPIVERVQPDAALQSFAPDANRVSLAQMMVALESHSTMAGELSLLYLPSITAPFTLKRLTQMVDALDRTAPLELIVTHLPDRTNDDSIRVLRKRLAQWIDQGLLRLYTNPVEQLPTLCLSSQLPHRIALQLRLTESKEPVEWFQTSSQRGVNQVWQDLQSLKAQASPVSDQTLEDPDTIVIFPTPQWGNLSLAELQQRLGIAPVLQGHQVQRLTYCDRYLQRSGAERLAALLQGNWLNENTHNVVQIQQLKDEYHYRSTQRRTEIERIGSHFTGRLTVEMRPYPQRFHPPFPHGRNLTIELHNHPTYRILFDKGIDFLEKNSDGTYRITEATYVVVTSAP